MNSRLMQSAFTFFNQLFPKQEYSKSYYKKKNKSAIFEYLQLIFHNPK